MDCRETYNLLSEYIDKELPLDKYLKIETHITICPICNAFLNTLKMTIKLSQRQRFITIPEEVHRRLIEFLRKQLNIS
jgi:predicted anti-sigma-YlaC factor YlaD